MFIITGIEMWCYNGDMKKENKTFFFSTRGHLT